MPKANKVGLRTRVLREHLDARGWLAADLSDMAGGTPSKRTINRWFDRARGVPDEIAKADRAAVEAIADGMGLPLAELIEPEAGDPQRIMRVAAAFGSRVFPDLLALFGHPPALPGGGAGEGAAGAEHFVHLSDTPVPTWRFASWSYFESIHAADTELYAAAAGKALAWSEQVGLGPDLAPELHCVCWLAAGDPRAGTMALAWMQDAVKRDTQPEVVWVGERALPVVSEPSLRVEIGLLLARALRLQGKVKQAKGVLGELAIDAACDPRLDARTGLEQCRVLHHEGLERDALAASQRVLAVLEQAGIRDRAYVEALFEQLHMADILGESALITDARERLRALTGHNGVPPDARIHRMLAASYFGAGHIRPALKHYSRAVDVGRAAGQAREMGLGGVNVALCHALLGEDDAALAYFEEATAFVEQVDTGPLGVGMVHMNFGRFCLERADFAAATKHLEPAAAHLQRSGHHPRWLAVALALLAEAQSGLGARVEALRLARRGYQLGFDSNRPESQAQALASWTLVAVPDKAMVRRLATAAESYLARAPRGSLALVRVLTRRRILQALWMTGAGDSYRTELEELESRARSMDILSEANIIRRLLAGPGG